jgi:hypothetical protein
MQFFNFFRSKEAVFLLWIRFIRRIVFSFVFFLCFVLSPVLNGFQGFLDECTSVTMPDR